MNTINKKHKLLPWIIWSICALFYFYQFLLQVSPSVMVPDLMRNFKVGGAALGNLAAFYFYAYAGMQIPVGVLLDRFGSKKLLTTACAICCLGCFGFAISHSLHQAIFNRTLIGLGSAFAAVGCLNIAARWFPPKRFALLLGLMLTIGMIGATVGEAPLAMIVGYFGWRQALLLFGFIGLVLVVLMGMIVRDPEQNQIEKVKTAPILDGLKYILKNPQTWLAAIYGGLMFAPTVAFGALWGVPYLMEAHHISRPAAAGIISFIFVGWAIGSPLFGWFSDFIRRRKTSMIIGSIGALLCITAVIYMPYLPKIIVMILLFCFGFFSSGFATCYSITKEINPPQYNATSLGFMNMMNTVGGAAAQPAIGLVLDYYWAGAMDHGARIYSLIHYQYALSAIPIMLLIALLLIPLIRETFCESKY